MRLLQDPIFRLLIALIFAFIVHGIIKYIYHVISDRNRRDKYANLFADAILRNYDVSNGINIHISGAGLKLTGKYITKGERRLKRVIDQYNFENDIDNYATAQNAVDKLKRELGV